MRKISVRLEEALEVLGRFCYENRKSIQIHNSNPKTKHFNRLVEAVELLEAKKDQQYAKGWKQP